MPNMLGPEFMPNQASPEVVDYNAAQLSELNAGKPYVDLALGWNGFTDTEAEPLLVQDGPHLDAEASRALKSVLDSLTVDHSAVEAKLRKGDEPKADTYPEPEEKSYTEKAWIGKQSDKEVCVLLRTTPVSNYETDAPVMERRLFVTAQAPQWVKNLLEEADAHGSSVNAVKVPSREQQAGQRLRTMGKTVLDIGKIRRVPRNPNLPPRR